MRHRTLVLAYHNVVPDDLAAPGDRSLHLSCTAFARQLEMLLSTHEIVPLTEVLQPSGDGTRPRAAITFDDAYRGAVTIGIAEVSRRGVPATIFVAPEFVGGQDFWWDALTRPGTEGLDAALRERALAVLKGQHRAIREWASQTGTPTYRVPQPSQSASEDELRSATTVPGITLGSHSWSHPNLNRLEPEQLRQELVRPLEWLRQRFDRVIPWISYPYGLSSPTVALAAADAGYAAALGISGGWVASMPADRYCLPRVNVPRGLSSHGFRLRGAGFFC